MKKFLSQIISAILGLYLAITFIPRATVELLPDSGFFGFPITAIWQIILILGLILGLLNFFVKPILNAITLPLRIITLGLFGFVVNMALVWIIDSMFKELSVPWLYPLLWTTLIIWGINTLLSLLIKEK